MPSWVAESGRWSRVAFASLLTGAHDMKRSLFGITAIAALVGTPALAADIPLKAPPPQPAAWTWTGFYLGLNAGWGWDAKVNNLLITTDPALGGYPAMAGGPNS